MAIRVTSTVGRGRILEKSGNEYVMSTPEEFVIFLRGEIAKWTKVVREANLRIE